MAAIAAQQVANSLKDLSIEEQKNFFPSDLETKISNPCDIQGGKMMEEYGSSTCVGKEMMLSPPENNIVLTKDVNPQYHYGFCAICLNKIMLQETALVKGCEHAYCVTCILQWATYKKEPTCPQCKHPFEFLNIHRSLDGSIHDYMFEESVCLLLRASWFKPLIMDERDEVDDDMEYFYSYEDEDEAEDLDDVYFGSSSRLRIGNRRWGDNGYVRSGRQEARPVHSSNNQEDNDPGPSRQPRRKEPAKETVGRRAKRALKREAADKAAAAKHQQHLVRLGRK